MILVAADHGVAGPCAAPVDDGVVEQHEAVGEPELEGAFDVADDLVPKDVPRPAILRLEADAVVHRVVDAVAPDPHVREPVVAFDAIVRGVEDVVAEDVDVLKRIGDAVGDVGDAVVRDRMAGRLVQLDSFAVEAFCGIRRVADDRIVGDVPVRPALLQVNRVVIVEEGAAPDDHIIRCGNGEGRIRLVPHRDAFEPEVTGGDVDAVHLHLAVAEGTPRDVARRRFPRDRSGRGRRNYRRGGAARRQPARRPALRQSRGRDRPASRFRRRFQ